METSNSNQSSNLVLQDNNVHYEKQENLFKPDMVDFAFALAVFVLGYLFSRWVLFSWHGIGVAIFTVAYLLCITAYLIKKDAFVKSRETYFWFAVTLLTGISYSLWDNAGFAPGRALFLFGSATYFVIIASGNAIMGKTSNYLLIDGLRTVFVIPFRNFINQYVSFSVLSKGEKSKNVFPVTIGIILAVILVAILTPLLERADGGGFRAITNFFSSLFTVDSFEIFFYLIFAIPVAAYLYGLVSGAIHKKGTDAITSESVENAGSKLRFLQPTTIYIVLGVVCVLYLVFILSQIPYFFSAFTGNLPAGWLNFADFARQGFFELVSIAAINLVILLAANTCCKKLRSSSRLLKIFNIMLSAISLLLISTAFSKMALYIETFGLTMPRLLPCMFMLFLAVVFILMIALQKRDFSVVRYAFFTGAVLMCVLSLSNPDAIVVRYNTNRYISGTLEHFDTEILYRAGNAGVISAAELYSQSQDDALKRELSGFLQAQSSLLNSTPFYQMSLERLLAMSAIYNSQFTMRNLQFTNFKSDDLVLCCQIPSTISTHQ